MGLAIKFVNYDSLNESSQKHIQLHKEYAIRGDILTHSHTEDGSVLISLGSIEDEQGDMFMFTHRRDKFNGTVIINNKDEAEEDSVMQLWGNNQGIDVPTRDMQFRNWLCDMVESRLEGVKYSWINRRLRVFNPFKSTLKPGNISITQSREKLEANKETSMSPGRAIRTMFPELQDNALETLVDKFRAMFSDKDYTVKVGETKADFKHAYMHQIEDMENPYTTNWRKSLANSCMRYSFDNQKHHPAEAFASPDFGIVWVENEHKQIAARAVYLKNNMSFAPIYGTSEQAMNLIEDWMAKHDAHKATCGEWLGAKLLRHPHNGSSDTFEAPYLDVSPSELTDDGEYLVIQECGEIDGSAHQGLLGTNDRVYCEACEESVHEHDIRFCPDGYGYCDYCFDDRFFLCEYNQDYYPTDEATRVYRRARWGIDWNVASDDAVNYSDDIVFVECRDEYWEIDDTFFCEHTEQHFTQCEIDNGEFVWHAETDMWYPEDDCPELEKEDA